MKAKDIFFNLKLTCNACHIEIFDGYFCADCIREMTVNDKICLTCGRSVINSEARCNSCKNRELFFDKARSLYLYKNPVAQMIKGFKYNGKKYLGEVFAKMLSPLFLQEFSDADIITCVPMFSKDEKKRGYNQTRILAKELSALVGCPFKEVSQKIKRTKRQAKLSAKERRSNLYSAFKVVDKSIIGKKAVVVDDVMTTGATVETLSERLVKAGADKVYVLTISSVGEREFIQKNKKMSFFAKIFKKMGLHKR